MHLLLAPFLARVVLVEPGKIAVVALVERLILKLRQAGLRQFRSIRSSVCWARIKAEVKATSNESPLRLEFAAGLAGFRDALVGEVESASR